MNVVQVEQGRQIPSSRKSLSVQAYQRIHRAILTHELAPEERVSEALLETRFGIGKAAVRTALTRLSADGLIITRSSKIQVVAPLTMKDVRSVFQMRNLIEPDAARKAAGRIDLGLLHRLNEACQADYVFGDKNQEYEFLIANRDFHLAIASACGNPIQEKFIRTLQDLGMRIQWVSLQIENRAEVWRHGHEEIIEALMQQDGAKAAECALEHLMNGERLVYEVLSTASQFEKTTITVS